ncbi:IRK-interacting protein [Macadamia integrifolia]|uniref:IRK-interacting protein n=1 Tax=Macadamia integrifolia TaxID=60698 RepID=UPI001C4EFAA8|nr:IRK-interacting protein [Macadamia integrifolia]
MAVVSSSSSNSSSSSKASSPPRPPPGSPLCFPIRENEGENEDEDEEQLNIRRTPNPASRDASRHHHPTPLHASATATITAKHKSSTTRKPSESTDADDRGVSCNKCRPNSREKISVVPLDANGHSYASPNGIFKSLLSSLTRKSPKTSTSSVPTSTSSREEQWKLAIAELSHKLIQTTRKRDEALLEASRLKHSMAELEKKLNKLEIYCHSLKSGPEVCSSSPLKPSKGYDLNGIEHQDKVIESFLNSVAEARSSVRVLSRSLTLQLRQMGVKVYERISSLLQPYEVKIWFAKNPRGLMFYLEALLNSTFYEEFESIGFQKSGSDKILNPIERCEAKFASFQVLKGLSWDEVLNKGTKHFSEEFSRFCDRKMSDIVTMLGWNKAWPEPLLQAFFGAAKSVWLVHLLAFSVHPSLPIFRVDKGVRFDGVYMEDMSADKAQKLVPSMVKIMVAPGFYVYNNVVKCKVLCKYNSSSSNGNGNLGSLSSP